jgi:hypothetical protein
MPELITEGSERRVVSCTEQPVRRTATKIPVTFLILLELINTFYLNTLFNLRPS